MEEDQTQNPEAEMPKAPQTDPAVTEAAPVVAASDASVTETPPTDTPTAEIVTAEAAPDYVPHTEAPAMFRENPGLSAVRVQLDDGRIGDLSRAGEFRAVATGS